MVYRLADIDADLKMQITLILSEILPETPLEEFIEDIRTCIQKHQSS